jgi:hypothetical protein
MDDALVRRVATPDLVTFASSPGDVTFTYWMPFWRFGSTIEAMKQALGPIVFSETWDEPPSTSADALKILSDNFKNLDPDSGSATISIPEVHALYKKVGLEFFTMQVERIVGQSTDNATPPNKVLRTPQRNILNAVLSHVITALDEQMPMKRNGHSNASGKVDNATTNIEEWAALCTESIVNSLATFSHKDAMESLLVPDADGTMMAFLALCLLPYMTQRYLSSFIPGSWNKRERADASFYDMRYAHILVHFTALDVLSMLYGMNVKAGQTKTAEEILAATTSILEAMKSTSDTEVSGVALTTMYDRIARLSNATKVTSADLHRVHKDFAQRRGTTMDLIKQNKAEQEALALRRWEFYAWTSTFISVTVASVLMISIGAQSAFLINSAIVIALISMYLGGTILANTMAKHVDSVVVTVRATE